MNKNIKYYALEVYTEEGEYSGILPQHAFISKKGKAVALCDQNTSPINEDEKPMLFSSLESEEISEDTVCHKCMAIVFSLKLRETEMQRFYDAALNEFHSTNKEIKELESQLKKLKLKRIKAQSDITKAEMKADELGLKDFL